MSNYRVLIPCLALLVCIQPITAASEAAMAVEIEGPDGIFYPNFTFAGIRGGIPDVEVTTTLREHGGVPNSGADVSAAFEKAIAAAVEAGGGAILLEAGDYILERPVIIFDDNIVIRGAGKTDTRILSQRGGFRPKHLEFLFPVENGSVVGLSDWIEVNANPDGLVRITLLANGKEIASFKRGPNEGNYQVLISGKTLQEKGVEAGKVSLQTDAEWMNGWKAEQAMEVEFNPAKGESSEAFTREPASNAVFAFLGGNVPGRLPLAEDGKRGDTRLVLQEEAPFAEGDLIRLVARDTERWRKELAAQSVPSQSHWHPRNYELEVAGVEGNVIHLRQPLRIDYPTADESFVSQVRPIRRSGVENLTIVQKKRLWIHGIAFEEAYQCWIRNVRIEKAGRNPFRVWASKMCEIRDVEIDDAWYKGGGGTAYVAFENSRDCLMDGVSTARMRHAPNVQWGAAGNVVRNFTSSGSGVQWHAGYCFENLYELCNVRSLFSLGGITYGYGAFSSAPDSMHGPQGPRNVLYNSDIESSWDGLAMRGGNKDWIIAYNRFQVHEGPGVHMRLGSSGHQIHRNVFILHKSDAETGQAERKKAHPAGAAVVFETLDCVNVSLTENQIFGTSTLTDGAPDSTRSEGNKLSVAIPDPLPARPEAPVESIYEWQMKQIGQ